MWGGGMSQVMSYNTDSFGGHVQIYVCVCVTQSRQNSGTDSLSLTSPITGQTFAVMRLSSDSVASKIINQTAYRAGMSVHM